MSSYSISDKELMNSVHQKSNIYDRFSPFSEFLRTHSSILLDEIRENLSNAIQLNEFQPGFTIWSTSLERFISSYGFDFTKVDHLKFVHFYLSILSDFNLNLQYAEICFKMLYTLLQKTRLLTRDDLTIDWRIIYGWAQIISDNHDSNYSLVIPPKDIELELRYCALKCSPYYSNTATQEILDELRPQMCPAGWDFLRVMKLFQLLLPHNLPPELHDQGFRLWLNELFNIWENIYNQTLWELCMPAIFSQLAWNNIGYVHWESWFPKIFTRLLRGFSLPVGKMGLVPLRHSYFEIYSARWIVAMIGNRNSCLQYLSDLLMSMKSFYHPSNNDKFQEKLIKFLLRLAEEFTLRVQLERTNRPSWSFAPEISYRLTEQDITDFVNCIKDYVFISIFNKSHAQDAVKACQRLSILRPELIIPRIVKKHFSSIDSLTEPHRFIAILDCLKHITRQICYSNEKIHVIPLLMSVLPGIDLNDMKKTSVTLDFLNTILMNIICVDCSSAVHNRNDLTDIEKQVCLSTGQFNDFINELLNRIFHLIDILSADIYDSDALDATIQTKFSSILFSIVHQSSDDIFRLIQEKMMFFVTGSCLSPQVRSIVSCLVQGLVKGNPMETLKYFLPKTCESIINIKSIDEKEDIELNWYLSLFVELVRARGDILVNYKSMILSVFHHSIHIKNKKTYEILANATTYLLQSLCQVYAIDYRLTTDNINELSFRAWGHSVDFDQLQVQFHRPNDQEIDFAWEFIDTFLYPELTLLNDKGLTISNNERLRSLTIIESIAIGCARMVSCIPNESVQDLGVHSSVPYRSKYQTQFPIYSRDRSETKENLRMRLLTDMEKLLDRLLENHSDDVLSINKTLNIYPLVSVYYGVFIDDVTTFRRNLVSDENLMKNKLIHQGQPIRRLIIQRMELQIQNKELYQSGPMTDIDRQIILKLFELSMNRYSEVRQRAQKHLLSLLRTFQCSYGLVTDRIVEILDSSSEIDDHDRIKGCLHVLLGDNFYFLLTRTSWQMKEKLWPLIARMLHANKRSITTLYGDISKKIRKEFSTVAIIQHANDRSKKSAIELWHRIEFDKINIKTHEICDQNNIQSYTNLMETLSQLLEIGTWAQQNITMSLLCLLLQRHIPIPLTCVKAFVDFLKHDNIKMREYATKGVAALCRLQKPARIYAEKIYSGDNCWLTIDGYQPPETQIEWEETCFLDRSYNGYYAWPKTIKYVLNKRTRYTQENMSEQVAIIYNRFMDKQFLVQTVQLMILNEKNEEKDFGKNQFRMLKGLFRNFGLAFFGNFMEQLYALIHEPLKEKQEGSHRVAAEIVAGMIRGSKHWTLEMLDKLWDKLRPFLTEVCDNLSVDTLAYWNDCFRTSIENRDPRRMYRVIDFLRTLIEHKPTSNTFNEAAHWSLVRNINQFDWRVPSVWNEIIEQAKLNLDHSATNVRDRIAILFAAAFMFDVELVTIKSVHQPNTNQFIDSICERLQQIIEIDDGDTKQRLNFVKTVIEMHAYFFSWCRQPIKSSLLRLFPYLCEIESMEVNDETFKQTLTVSRLKIALSYLHAEFIDELIQQLIKICKSSKWHARRAAIEFVQNMVFCNLFNVRSHTQELRELVIQCLFDEQYEVRVAASTTLSGLYQCRYLQVTEQDLDHFCAMSKADSTQHIVQRHGGILGLCSIVLSSPYDIPSYIPRVLMILCNHSHDHNLIQKSIKTCLSEFRRTHYDSWHEHRQEFTDDQLAMLADILISHSYYA